MAKTHNKLVRDKIPEMIKADGGVPITRVLNNDDYLKELINKLQFECDKLENGGDVGDLADIQEIVMAISERMDIAPGKLAEVMAKKAVECGAFKKRIYLESVE
mgnify:FL=1